MAGGSKAPEELRTQMYLWDGTEKRIAKSDTDGNLKVKIEDVTTTEDGAKVRLDVTTGLSTMPGFNIPPYTRIDATYPDTVTEVYAYKDGATLVATIAVVYTDTTKQYITSAVKT